MKRLGNFITSSIEYFEERIKLVYRRRYLNSIIKKPCNSNVIINDALIMFHYGFNSNLIPFVYANSEQGIIINSKMKDAIDQGVFSKDALNAMLWHEYGHIINADRHIKLVRNNKGHIAEFEADDYAIMNGYGLGMVEILEWYSQYLNEIGKELLRFRINRILYGDLDLV